MGAVSIIMITDAFSSTVCLSPALSLLMEALYSITHVHKLHGLYCYHVLCFYWYLGAPGGCNVDFCILVIVYMSRKEIR